MYRGHTQFPVFICNLSSTALEVDEKKKKSKLRQFQPQQTHINEHILSQHSKSQERKRVSTVIHPGSVTALPDQDHSLESGTEWVLWIDVALLLNTSSFSLYTLFLLGREQCRCIVPFHTQCKEPKKQKSDTDDLTDRLARKTQSLIHPHSALFNAPFQWNRFIKYKIYFYKTHTYTAKVHAYHLVSDHQPS